MGAPPDRLAALQKELAANPASQRFYHLGELLRREGRLADAVHVLRSGLAFHPRYVAAWVALGRAHLANGDLAQAVTALEQSIELDPINPVSWRLLGEARLAEGDRMSALDALQYALQLAPGDEVLAAAVGSLAEEAEAEARSRVKAESAPDVPVEPPVELPAELHPESAVPDAIAAASALSAPELNETVPPGGFGPPPVPEFVPATGFADAPDAPEEPAAASGLPSVIALGPGPEVESARQVPPEPPAAAPAAAPFAPSVVVFPAAAVEPEPEPAPEPEPPAEAPGGPATVTLARLYLRQQELTTAATILERVIEREGDNQEARDLLALVRDMMEPLPEPAPPPSANQRKIAALQQWLASLTLGRA